MRIILLLIGLLSITSASLAGERIMPPRLAQLMARVDIWAQTRANHSASDRQRTGFHSGSSLNSDPMEARDMSDRAPGGITSLQKVASAFAGTPFDTVYVDGEQYGTTRRLYTYDIAGRMQSELIQRLSGETWFDEERTSCMYTLDGRMTSKVRESLSLRRILERERYSCDAAGRTVSQTSENSYNSTNTLFLSRCDSMQYDMEGREIFSSQEGWNEGRQEFGSRSSTLYSDSSSVSEHASWSPRGWTDTQRWVSHTSPSTGTEIQVLQTWSGSEWLNGFRWVLTSDVRGRSTGSQGYLWIERGWVITLRETVHYTPDGLTEEHFTEVREDTAWSPSWKWLLVFDNQQRLVLNQEQQWDNGWVISRRNETVYGPGESFRSLDSSWLGRELISVGIQETDSEGRWIESGVILGSQYQLPGWRSTRSFSRSGLEEEIIRSVWFDGHWELDSRYAFTYDTYERLATARHCVRENNNWVLSSHSRGWNDLCTWGNDWSLADPHGNLYRYTDFATLSFCYREGASDVHPEDGSLPLATTLRQNYPNPFNPSTTIQFSLAQSGFTVLSIYDVLGREVAQLVNEQKEPGNHEVRFDASGLASGMYISKFTSGAVTQTRKMILMR